MNISGNTVFITGGGTGIGLALAEVLLEQGNRVIICGRRKTRLLEARKRMPELEIRVCDVSKASSRSKLVEWITCEFKDLNILVNNAGIQRPVDLLKGARDLPDANAEVSTNLTAPIHLSALLIPHLKRRKEAVIINISSGLAFTPIAAIPVYCATKAALHSFSLSLRYQLRETSIRVFEIAPPMVATELSGGGGRANDNNYIMTPEAAAAGILDAMKKNDYEVALGTAENLRNKREALFSALNP
jgi:uncharacterized oxidoreductase